MSNRWFALWFVWMATTLGWCWRIAEDRDLAVAPLGYVGFLSMALWLWARLERMRRSAPPTHKPHPTCIDVTGTDQTPRSEWACGPECPKEA